MLKSILYIVLFCIIVTSCYDKELFSEDKPVIVNPEYSMPFGEDTISISYFLQNLNLIADIPFTDTLDYVPFDGLYFEMPDSVSYTRTESFILNYYIKENETVESLMLRLNFTNYIPASLAFRIQFTDISNNVLFSLTEDPVVLGAASPIGNSTQTVPYESFLNDFYLTEAQIDLLQLINQIQLIGVMKFENDIDSEVLLSSEQLLLYEIGIRIKLHHSYE